MPKKINNLKEEYPEIKNVLSLTSKILKLLYFIMIIIIVLSITFLIKEWGILKFLLTVLKVVSPVFIGFIIAWLFNPLVIKLEDSGLKRVIGTIIIYSAFLIFIYFFFSALIPTIYKQLIDFLGTIPDLLVKGEGIINNLFSKLNKELFDIDMIKENIINGMQEYGYRTMDNLPNYLINSIGGIFTGIGTFGLSIILGFYILFDFEKIKNHFVEILPKKFHFEVDHLLNTIGVELRKSVNGTLFVASIVFLGATIGFIIIGLKAPVLFGFLCGFTDLIPFVGPLIGGSVAVIVGFSQNTLTGFLALVIVIVVQQLENLIIQPIVMAKSTKLHPVTIILGLLIFGYFFGIMGMMLATPILSLIKILFRFAVAKFDLTGYDSNELGE